MSQTFKKIYYSILEIIKPIKGVLYFLFLFFLFEFIWKICVPAHENGGFYLFTKNCTSWLNPLCRWTADICYWIIHNMMGYDTINKNGVQIYFNNSLRLDIVWECTGLKQVLQFIFILICFGGKLKRKLIFIPCSIVILLIFNIIRLVVTLFIIKDGFPEWFIPVNEIMNGVKWDDSMQTYRHFYNDWFYFFHDNIFRWVYYDGVVFLLWLVWYEKFSNKKHNNQ